MRKKLVLLHRYVGLVMAGFLIIAGLTGALLVWYYELDALINPQWLQVEPPAAHSEPRSPFALRDQVDAAYPDANVHWMMLAPPDAHSPVRFFLSTKPGAPALPIDEVFVNPYAGQILGGRLWGDLSQGLANLMPFVYRLHHSLALGTLGTWIFGIIALLWTLDCFVGAWLTFPRRAAATPGTAPAASGHAGPKPGKSAGVPAATNAPSTCTAPAASGPGPCCSSSPGAASPSPSTTKSTAPPPACSSASRKTRSPPCPLRPTPAHNRPSAGNPATTPPANTWKPWPRTATWKSTPWNASPTPRTRTPSN